MLSDTEFLLIRNNNRQSSLAADSAQRIINVKNEQLVTLVDQVQALQRELQVERGKRKMAELKLMRRAH